VGPTPKPEFFLFIITLFNRKDFPVLYFPATEITPTLSLIDPRNYLASSETLNVSIFHIIITIINLTILLIVVN
jgi:hypothetical protein